MYGLSYEHTPSGIDNMTLVLREEQVSPSIEEALITALKEQLQVENVKIERDVALIMLVGEGMRDQIGTMATAAKAFKDQNINIDMVNQGASENSVMFGIQKKDEDKAVESLYHAFFD